jgi:hypothetical protein
MGQKSHFIIFETLSIILDAGRPLTGARRADGDHYSFIENSRGNHTSLFLSIDAYMEDNRARTTTNFPSFIVTVSATKTYNDRLWLASVD